MTTSFRSRALAWLRPRRLFWIALVAIVSIASLHAMGDAATAAPPDTAEASVGSITQVVQAAGVLTPGTQVDVGAQVSGQVTAIHVELGQTVLAGQLLVSIDPDTARTDVRVAEAAVTEQRAAMDATMALHRRAEAEAGRARRLLQAGGASQSAVESAEAELHRLGAEHKGQLATLDRLTAELAKKRLALSRTSITAPIGGVVVNIAVAQGQTVNASQATPVLLTLADIDRMTVKTKVAEADVLKVKAGQDATFTTLSGLAKPLRGRVRVIQPVPEKSGNASFYNVLFEVQNPGRVLLPHMTAHVRIETGAASGTLTIPSIALGNRHDDGRYDVFTWTEQGGIVRRRIRIGLQDASRTEVLEGLKPGERVLLSPADGAKATQAPAGGSSSAVDRR
ncbi:MAG: efflux RND transporter periplasmic adaptor subunit [Pseudomonadota bacterium]